MKVILRSGTVKFPEGVTCTVKARVVTVKGPRGVLVQDFKHLPIDLQFTDESCTELKVDRWFTSGKAPAAIRSCCSHIENMVTGVTKVGSRPSPGRARVAARDARRQAGRRVAHSGRRFRTRSEHRASRLRPCEACCRRR